MGDIFGVFIGLIIIVLLGVFVWRLMKTSLRRSEYFEAYKLAKLRSHAEKYGIDLDKELELLDKVNFWGTKVKRVKQNQKSDLQQVDAMFEELEEEEKATKKKGSK